jgi:hypothetical protein
MHWGINLYFEAFALFSSIFFYLQKRNKIILYFIPFLFLTLTIEFIGSKYSQNLYYVKNIRYGMYNIFTTIEFMFYGFLFSRHFSKKTLKKIALYFIPSFATLSLLNILFIQGFSKTFNTYTFLIGSFFIVIFCCFYFYESVLPEKIDDQLMRQPFFWINSGLLIYYLGSVIINALFDYLTSNDLRLEGIKIYTIINNSLIIVLYLSFCIAFFLCPNNKKTSLSQS